MYVTVTYSQFPYIVLQKDNKTLDYAYLFFDKAEFEKKLFSEFAFDFATKLILSFLYEFVIQVLSL